MEPRQDVALGISDCRSEWDGGDNHPTFVGNLEFLAINDFVVEDHFRKHLACSQEPFPPGGLHIGQIDSFGVRHKFLVPSDMKIELWHLSSASNWRTGLILQMRVRPGGGTASD